MAGSSWVSKQAVATLWDQTAPTGTYATTSVSLESDSSATFTYDAGTTAANLDDYDTATTSSPFWQYQAEPLWRYGAQPQSAPQSMYVNPMSPEEKKQKEERRKRQEKEQKKNRLKFLKAERGAQRLLRELVSEIDFRNYKRTGYIEARLESGKIVRIGRFINDPVFDPRERKILPDGRTRDLQVAHLCIHGGDHQDPLIPPTDRVITKLLLAKNDEKEFFKRAHINQDNREVITNPKERINFRKTLRAPGEGFPASIDYANFELQPIMPEPQNIPEPELAPVVATPEEYATSKIKEEYPEEFKHAKEELEHAANRPGQRSTIRIPVIPKMRVLDDEELALQTVRMEAIEVSYHNGRLSARKV